ncbi:glycosyltransferase [Flavicella marina]|uniref:glycosyltransferase n=1 Tax=Flavicella marina TaxID=1475951 RepID=UPI00186B0F95|nr:glycosyltransferase [Flavicella marina]
MEKTTEQIKINTTNKSGKLLSIVIVNYRSWRHLEKCLDSILAIDSAKFSIEVIVVDNDLMTEDRAQFQKRFDSVSIVGNTGNNGFANGCNYGANLATGDFLMFLNPDTIVNQEAFEKMLLAIENNPEYGIVSCTQLNKNGDKEKEIRFFPNTKVLFGLFRAFYRIFNKKILQEKYQDSKAVIFPDWVSGSLILIRRDDFITVGGWNEDYWMYFEDVDLCKKVTDIGKKIALLRNVNIIHNHGGASRINVKISAMTRSHVLISRHIYVCNYFEGPTKLFTQSLLVLYVLISKFVGGLLGMLFFFLPKMRLQTTLLKNMITYYISATKNSTWLSLYSRNFFKNKVIVDSNEIRIGFDAKRIYHNTTGLGNYSRDLVSILTRFFSENKYFLYNPKEKRIDRLADKKNIIEVLPNSKFWKRYSSIWRQGPVIKQLKEDKIQLFHGLSGEVPRGLKKANIKSIVTIHDLIFIRYPKLYSYMDRKIHFRKFYYAVHSADIVIAITEQTKRDIVKFLKADPLKIRVVYQGCHEKFKASVSDVFKLQVRKRYKLPKNFILNVGTIEERKNLLLAVKAIRKLDTTLVVVGAKTKYYQKVCNYIQRKGIEHKVLFLENVVLDDLVALYQMAGLFVYPSVFEGFGIPIIEALYSKTPVITSTGSCFSEAGGPATIYVAPDDYRQLRKKISEVLTDNKLRDSMVAEGYRFVQKFNDEQIAENIMKVYKELL